MTAKARFVVVDYGSTVHGKTEPCPPWCHLCPQMGGGVMPYCYGSVCQNTDEHDLLHCTCDPNDPIAAHADLVRRTDVLVNLLREKRRERRTDRLAVKRLAEIARAMRWSTDKRGQSEVWGEVATLASRLAAALLPDEAKS